MFAAEKRAKNYEVLIREYEAGDCGGIRKERSSRLNDVERQQDEELGG